MNKFQQTAINISNDTKKMGTCIVYHKRIIATATNNARTSLKVLRSNTLAKTCINCKSTHSEVAAYLSLPKSWKLHQQRQTQGFERGPKSKGEATSLVCC